ncbi:hypothetical protein CPB84DRAFT_1305546 [Gymnopilus junonius]|uniref:Uncharacterized protein n=1 Tax=Gymnopilus junonius TaxID=109634 RepID=A0A9P5TLZ1_GYMJU|nr:hypothetical protein CPB84DRAFT_1305546 [Gymnopilus junonius]
MDVNIDDTNTTLIQYVGNWDVLNGSTRQWNGTVHSTLDPNATATFQFRGYQVWVWGTTPAGEGSNLVSFTLDGGTPNITSRTSNVSAVYNERYYSSPILPDTYHTLVVTNKGSDASGNTQFMLDRFEFTSSDAIPQFAPPGTSSTSSTSIPTVTVASSGSVRSSGGSKTPVGGIVGGVIGGLV